MVAITERDMVETIRSSEQDASLTVRHCEGALLGETVDFQYALKKSTFEDFCNWQDIPEKDKEEAKKEMYEMGLSNIEITMIQGEALKDSNERGHYYVLLPGWTGTEEIYTDVKDESTNMTVAEKILALDPNAKIITMTGKGFSGTPFREDVLKDKKQLVDLCSPVEYARTVDFAVRKMLNVQGNVTVGGHSWGGAAAMCLAGKYENYDVQAWAPAIFPDRDSYKEIQEIKSYSNKILGDAKRAFKGATGFRDKTDMLFTSFARLSSFSEKVSRLPLMRAPTRSVVGLTHGLIRGYFMGDKNPVLGKLHTREFQNFAVSEAVMDTLARGVDLNLFTDAQLEQMLKKSEVTLGDSDTLVDRNDVAKWVLAVEAHLLRNYSEGGQPIDSKLQELNDYLKADYPEILAEGPAKVDYAGVGHYGPVNETTSVLKLVARAKETQQPAEVSELTRTLETFVINAFNESYAFHHVFDESAANKAPDGTKKPSYHNQYHMNAVYNCAAKLLDTAIGGEGRFGSDPIGVIKGIEKYNAENPNDALDVMEAYHMILFAITQHDRGNIARRQNNEIVYKTAYDKVRAEEDSKAIAELELDKLDIDSSKKSKYKKFVNYLIDQTIFNVNGAPNPQDELSVFMSFVDQIGNSYFNKSDNYVVGLLTEEEDTARRLHKPTVIENPDAFVNFEYRRYGQILQNSKVQEAVAQLLGRYPYETSYSLGGKPIEMRELANILVRI